MRPIRLTVRAFGPFAAEQVLDFRLLGDRRFFLIHGPTGAGKTTILDAMCFALYGVTSGAERAAKDMRSDHADASALTEVTFDFSLGPATYRVTRRPEQERRKKRGEGTTTEGPKATLWQRTGLADDGQDGTVLASTWKAVDERVEQLLGFRADQFRQVVVLPQGQFRRLLASNSSERQTILEALFQTQFYRHVEEALKAAAKAVADQVNSARQKQALILEQAAVASYDELDGKRTATRSALDDVRNRLQPIREADAKAQSQLTEGAQISAKISERDEATTALHDLEAKTELFAGKQSVLNLARKAAVLLDAELALVGRAKEAEAAHEAQAKAGLAVKESKACSEGADGLLRKEQAREAEREESRQASARLQELGGRVSALVKATNALSKAQAEVDRLTVERGDAQASVTACQQVLKEKQDAHIAAQTAATQVVALRIVAADALLAQKRRARLEAVRNEASGQEAKHLKTMADFAAADKTHAETRERLRSLEDAWATGQAAVLAQSLVPGSPCPVCGSTTHPIPAHSDHDLPTEASLKRLRKQGEDLEIAREDFRKQAAAEAQRLTALSTEAVSLEENLGDLRLEAPASLEAKAKEESEALTAAETARAQLQVLVAEVALRQTEEGQARERFEKAEGALRGAVGRRDQAQTLVAERALGIPENLREASALEQAKQQADAKVRALDNALAAAREGAGKAKEKFAASQAAFDEREGQARVAHQRVETQRREFAERVAAAGFHNAEAYRAAKRTGEEIDGLDAEIRGHQGDLWAARDRAKRAGMAAAGLVPSDMAQLQRAAEEAKRNLEECLKREATLVAELKQVDDQAKAFEAAAADLDRLEKDYVAVGHVSEVANGRNAYGITFERFVLGALLDDVLRAASHRLRIMSRGRFTLQRAIVRADQRLAGGLDLEVADAYTGTARDVATLSGGEGFLASLSLALGLADVVQAYAGGIRLETIFVDEGFGSLDPEALDLAVRALIDLQQGGRLVGVISHVPELKELVDARLEVRMDRRGSAARFVIG